MNVQLLLQIFFAELRKHEAYSVPPLQITLQPIHNTQPSDTPSNFDSGAFINNIIYVASTTSYLMEYCNIIFYSCIPMQNYSFKPMWEFNIITNFIRIKQL